jgi:hypothetical protein
MRGACYTPVGEAPKAAHVTPTALQLSQRRRERTQSAGYVFAGHLRTILGTGRSRHVVANRDGHETSHLATVSKSAAWRYPSAESTCAKIQCTASTSIDGITWGHGGTVLVPQLHASSWVSSRPRRRQS